MKERAVPAPLLELRGLCKTFGAQRAVDDVSLTIAAGETFCLLGGSGAARPPLLRLIAGFEQADHGQVLLDGHDLTGVPPYRRPLNPMFQSYALFPHLSVRANVAFGLEQDGLPRRDIAARVDAMLALVQLTDCAGRRPHELSGGQRQRVALARALVKRPRLVLLDEPLAALDRKLRQATQFELLRLQRELGVTFVVVTHDQEEAMTLASRIGVMQAGRIVQVDTPRAVYERPANRFVADFVGTANLFEATVHAVDDTGAELACAALGAHLRHQGPARQGERVWWLLRPEVLRLEPVGGVYGTGNRLPATLGASVFLGDAWRVEVHLADGRPVIVTMPHAARAALPDWTPGGTVELAWDAAAGVLLRA